MAGDECCETLRKCLQPLIDLIFPRRNDENANYVPVPESEYAPNVEQDPLLSEALAKNYQTIVDNAAKEFLQAAKVTRPRSNSSASSVPSEQIALIRQRLVTAIVDPAVAASPPQAVIIPLAATANNTQQQTATVTAAAAAPAPVVKELASASVEDVVLTAESYKLDESSEPAKGTDGNNGSNNSNDKSTKEKDKDGSKKKKSKKTKPQTNSG